VDVEFQIPEALKAKMSSAQVIDTLKKEEGEMIKNLKGLLEH
jgi:hypothetical protein